MNIAAPQHPLRTRPGIAVYPVVCRCTPKRTPLHWATLLFITSSPPAQLVDPLLCCNPLTIFTTMHLCECPDGDGNAEHPKLCCLARMVHGQHLVARVKAVLAAMGSMVSHPAPTIITSVAGSNQLRWFKEVTSLTCWNGPDAAGAKWLRNRSRAACSLHRWHRLAHAPARLHPAEKPTLIHPQCHQ
jgi:hypothetical protein